MVQEIQEFIDNLLAAWNAHDIEQASSFYAPDYHGKDVSEPTPQEGQAGIRRSLQRYWTAFPDLYLTREELITQGERVTLVWTASGTHKGSLMNIPATGRAIRVPGVSLLTVKNGQVTCAHYIWDLAGLLRDLGLLPELPEVE